jgi:hypothetical protein
VREVELGGAVNDASRLCHHQCAVSGDAAPSDAESGALTMVSTEAARVVRRGGHVYVKDVFLPPRPAHGRRVDSRTLAAFDDMWHLAARPTLPEVAAALDAAGCPVVTMAETPTSGTTDSSRRCSSLIRTRWFA